ncbi:hypothetical protein [Mesorhizobium sp. WSM3859]|uniref:hypothetical protein n=1 Tax=Mesorhizobium sp. WSM3859 TaxID=2029402 RepID=UPI0011409E1E|nr:hypothetical protein [Mesorhizobium sp. WSM3859]
MSPKLRAVIKAHKKAHAFWLSVCGCTDTLKLGREATADEEALWDKGNDGEYAALWDVCRFPARTTADQAAKGRYLRKFHSWKFGYLEEDQVDALMLSMIEAGKGAK